MKLVQSKMLPVVYLIIFTILIAWIPGLGVPAFASTSLTPQFVKLNSALGAPSVDARIDRVWHAIPGLTGWKLDIAQSEIRTIAMNDGKMYLVWLPQPPQVRLATLPPEPIFRGPKEEKSVCLMVNVSWGEQYLPEMLRVLANEKVQATFFLDGAWVKHHRELARKIVEDGHCIGSHGFGHPDFRKLSNKELGEQIVNTNHLLYHELGAEIRCIAPPSGSFDSQFVKLARAHNIYTILWTADTVDWQHPTPEVIVNRVSNQLVPGALVLMHPTDSTVKALPNMIRMLKNRGYELKTVDALVGEQRVVKPPTVLSQLQ